ncbi:helix-turn-helix transcriptional regulator [Metapseudomonas resinovorans]|uniref:Putative LuxR family transcriptional regulator n=1 Tax=Metapseudomonas resinovorans NBRC 106553 TaxID=1245471 RepID=S6BFX3_METRE|nr:helix-turn-helix transcriptional regulator [Pseudomonas resinovorans]BAN47959.1 putative LuxR family transcriptional regulator [Pseudomonas resinovorans NBRC 106553]
MHGQLTQWAREITQVLIQPPGQAQLHALTAWLQHLAAPEHLALFVHEGCGPPLVLFDTFAPALRPVFVTDYQAGPYLLDPFHLACLFGQADGLYSMRRLAPERFETTEYFRTYYRHLQLAEKLGYIVSLGEGSRAVLWLVRRRDLAAFSEEERGLLQSAMPVVAQVLRSAWAVHRPGDPCITHDLDQRVGDEFERFGQGVLTARECEVARLLLEGHSNQSASQRLQIAPGTVKVHRRSLYEKLQVGSQSELLALFVRQLKGRRED